MEYIESLDKKIDGILDNDILYTILIVGLIIYCVFSPNNNIINFDNNLVKILIIMFILYFSTKDLRISLLLTIIFLIEIDKLNIKEVNDKITLFLIRDGNLQEKNKVQ
jgi:hypothetical protein